jgi:hypothetical protein
VQRVDLSWQAVSGATSYDVYWSTAAGVTATAGTKISGVTTTSYAHTGLLPGTYHYVVSAVGAGGEGTLSTEVSAPVYAVAFASSTTSGANGGNLGAWDGAAGKTGLGAGDAICQSLAAAGGLSGTFRAWLSDPTDDAYCRIHGLAGKKSASCGQATLPASAGPWVRADDVPWAGTIDVITRDSGAEDVRVPLAVDEHGAVIAVSARWLMTGTEYDGSAASTDRSCSSWTSSTDPDVLEGMATAVSASWGSGTGSACTDTNARLLCMQQGSGPALPPPVSSGAKRAFMTSAAGNGYLRGWPAAGTSTGIEAGHTICRTLAAAAGLANPTHYKAWLGGKDPGATTTTGPSPSDALTSDGPWERVDGVLLAWNKAALTGTLLLTGLAIDETGADLGAAAQARAWTGEHRGYGFLDQTTCANWGSHDGSYGGVQGFALDASEAWSHDSIQPCDSIYHLYCFED